jgi:hypothetical protein
MPSAQVHFAWRCPCHSDGGLREGRRAAAMLAFLTDTGSFATGLQRTKVSRRPREQRVGDYRLKCAL